MSPRSQSTTEDGLSWSVKVVYFILITNAAAAFLSLTLAPGSEDWFTWTIVPDASAYVLAVMYLNAFLLVALAWSASSWAETRSVFVLVMAFSIAATIVTVTNFDPFTKHPWYHQGYWLGAYAILFVSTPVVFAREERAHGGRLQAGVPLSTLTRVIGGITALALAAVGLGLLIDPVGMSDSWPWPVTPLVGRLLAVWLLSLSITYCWVLWDGDWKRGRAIFMTAPVSGIGLALVPLVDNGDVQGGSLLVYLVLASLLLANVVAWTSQGRSGTPIPRRGG